MKLLKIYLDNCVFNRPFDDQSQERIYLETKALSILFKYVEKRKIHFYSSDVLKFEMEKTSNRQRRNILLSYLDYSSGHINVDINSVKRAEELSSLGFCNLDALHLAVAEKQRLDFFVTCDDQILKIAKKKLQSVKIKVLSLMEFITLIIGESYD